MSSPGSRSNVMSSGWTIEWSVSMKIWSQATCIVMSAEELTPLTIKRHHGSMDYRVSGDSENLNSGVRIVRGLYPDVVISEMGGEATPTFEAIPKLREDLPGLGIVLLSADSS